ncbi:MAG: alternative ribosome rescue aminoacyl-tRNA hydrolase ArfB [Planctomycetota bacterium]
MNDLYVNGRLTIPGAQLQATYSRSGGPGGQNVNKVNSKVTLRWRVRDNALLDDAWRKRFEQQYGTRITKDGDIVLQSELTRDAPKNLEDARQRLASMLRLTAVAPKKRKKTRPSRGAIERRLAGKRERSERKKSRSWKGD